MGDELGAPEEVLQNALDAGAVPLQPPMSAPPVPGVAYQSNAEVERLMRSTRRLRGWVIALSVALALVILPIGGCAALFAFSIAGTVATEGGEAPNKQAESLEKAVRNAYGDTLESVSAEEVQMNDDVPFPFTLLESEFGTGEYLVRYRLKDSNAEFSNVFMDESEFSYQGFIPIENPFSSRLEIADLRSLLDAYAEQTDEPAGGVNRYMDNMMEFSETGDLASAAGTVTIEGKPYRADELWNVYQGRSSEDATTFYDSMEPGLAYVFHRDPKTHEFFYLGRERSAW